MVRESSWEAVVERLRRELRDDFPDWRVGRGGSGRWWAVLGNQFVQASSPEELREQLWRRYRVTDTTA